MNWLAPLETTSRTFSGKTESRSPSVRVATARFGGKAPTLQVSAKQLNDSAVPELVDGLAAAVEKNGDYAYCIDARANLSTRSRRAAPAVSSPWRRARAAPWARLLLRGAGRPRAAPRSVFRPGSSFAKSSPRRSSLARGQPPSWRALLGMSFAACQSSAAAAKVLNTCVLSARPPTRASVSFFRSKCAGETESTRPLHILFGSVTQPARSHYCSSRRA